MRRWDHGSAHSDKRLVVHGQSTTALAWTGLIVGARSVQGQPVALSGGNFLRSDQTALRITGERKLPQLVLRRRARWKSRGAASAAADLRRVLTIAGATIVETGLALPHAFAQFTSDGHLGTPGSSINCTLFLANSCMRQRCAAKRPDSRRAADARWPGECRESGNLAFP